MYDSTWYQEKKKKKTNKLFTGKNTKTVQKKNFKKL